MRLRKIIKFIIAWFRIPKGEYCHSDDSRSKSCPYWRKIYDRLEQEDGWCDYLGKGDIEIKNESYSTGIYPEEIKDEIFEGFSLLWDKCKECGIKISE